SYDTTFTKRTMEQRKAPCMTTLRQGICRVAPGFFQHEETLHGTDAGQGSQFFTEEMVIGVHVAYGNAENEIECTGQLHAFHHCVKGQYIPLETQQHFAAVGSEQHVRKGHQATVY